MKKLLLQIDDFSWRVECQAPDKTMVAVSPAQMANSKTECSADGWKKTYTGCQALGEAFQVTVQWRRDDKGMFLGKIAYSGNHSKFRVKNLHFPVVSLPFPQDGAGILAGSSQGWIYRLDNVHEDQPKELRNNFEAMQFTAILYGGDGVYFDCRDTRFHLKQYSWLRRGDQILYSVIHLMPQSPRHARQYELPFVCGASTFEGDWYEAAMLYREWAQTTSNCRRRIRRNPMRDIGVWCWNRGAGDAVSKPVVQLSKDAGVPAALDWYWWHQCPYDTDYPDFWPPREGTAKFRSILKHLKKAGVFTQVYLNGLTWDVDSTGYAHGGKESVIENEDGSPYAIEYNKYTHHRLGYMCGAGKPFQKRLAGVVKHLVDEGVSGVYLDMIGCSTGHPCYSHFHHHAPGGGTYQVAGYRKFVKSLRAAHPDTIFSTECCNEAFLDLFESAIVLSPSMERCENQVWIDCVPAFSAVYHGATALFGNYALIDGIPPWDPLWPAKDRWQDEEPWEEIFPDQFCCELARTIVWGMQPTVCKLTMEQTRPDGRFAPFYRFLVDMCKFYYAHRDFLFDGRLLNPKGFTTRLVDVGFLQRGLFTTKEKGKRLYRKLPAILHSVWEAPDGRKALFAINYTLKEQSYEYINQKGAIPPRSALFLPLE